MTDIAEMLIKWRTSKRWIAVDVRKMFWQIKVDQVDQNLQYTLWRNNPHEKLGLYSFTAKVMGSTDSMSIARQVLMNNAKIHNEQYPKVESIIKDNCYADDITVFEDSKDIIIKDTLNLIAVLGKLNFTAAKIISDDMPLLAEIPNESIHPSLKDKHKE